MCVAIIKPKGKTIPSYESLMNCFYSNPDGAGYAVVRNGKVYISKGFFTLKSFMDAIKKEDIRVDEPVLFHMRIATHGGISSKTTHPFPISGSYEKMKKLSCYCNTALIHNGIFSDTEGTSFYNNISDTMVYVKMIARTGLHQKAYNNDVWRQIMSRTVEDCKIAMLNKEGEVLRLGDGWKEHEGCWFSNTSYYKFVSKKSGKKTSVKAKDKGKTEIIKIDNYKSDYKKKDVEVDDIYFTNENKCPRCFKPLRFLSKVHKAGIKQSETRRCYLCKVDWIINEEVVQEWTEEVSRKSIKDGDYPEPEDVVLIEPQKKKGGIFKLLPF